MLYMYVKGDVAYANTAKKLASEFCKENNTKKYDEVKDGGGLTFTIDRLFIKKKRHVVPAKSWMKAGHKYGDDVRDDMVFGILNKDLGKY